MTNIHLRPVREADAPALAAIYAPYVRETAITFEYEPPDAAEFRRRIAAIAPKYPYLVAERDGEVLGYAYTSPLRTRAAYGWTAETSIYLRRDLRGNGLGQRFYHALEELSRAKEVLPDLSVPLFVYAYGGETSARAVSRLKDMGYTQVHDIGGLKKCCGSHGYYGPTEGTRWFSSP